MLAFITSLRHPQNSADYSRVESLLRATLRSIAQQTSDDYVVIVVGNQKPSFEFRPTEHFVAVDFPPPAPPTGPKTARAPFVWDKGTKIGIGLVAAREFQPDRVMVFDADDFIHRDVVKRTAGSPSHPGWVIDRGWIYSKERNAYRAVKRFNRVCGSCHILPFESYGVSEELTVESTQSEVADAFGERLEAMLGAHRGGREWHASRGRILEPIGFAAAAYQVDTGENHSGAGLLGFARPLNRRMIDDFGIVSQYGPMSTWWRSIGPSAFWGAAVSAARFVRRAGRRLARIGR
jgi:glycosyltransferase involved in cell wall biosynthesis